MAEIPTTFLSENGILTRLDGSKGDEEKEGRSGEVDSRDGRICDLMRPLGARPHESCGLRKMALCVVCGVLCGGLSQLGTSWGPQDTFEAGAEARKQAGADEDEADHSKRVPNFINPMHTLMWADRYGNKAFGVMVEFLGAPDFNRMFHS